MMPGPGEQSWRYILDRDIYVKQHLFLRNVQRGKRQQKHPRHGKERGNAGHRGHGDDRKGNEAKGIFLFLLKRIINNFFSVGGGWKVCDLHRFESILGVWDCSVIWKKLRFSSSLLLSDSFPRGEFEPGPGRHANQWAMPHPKELCHTPMSYSAPHMSYATLHTPVTYATPQWAMTHP